MLLTLTPDHDTRHGLSVIVPQVSPYGPNSRTLVTVTVLEICSLTTPTRVSPCGPNCVPSKDWGDHVGPYGPNMDDNVRSVCNACLF